MKNLSNILIAAAAGVALITFSNASFLATVSGEVVMGGLAAVAVLGIAVSDYARRPRPLTVRASVVRPEMSVRKTTVYGVRRCSALVERSAA
jgi:hypothetical protein